MSAESSSGPAKRYFVYVITNKTNGKVYVGKAADVDHRWCVHKRRARYGETSALYGAMRKYGEHSFEHETVACFIGESDAFAFEPRPSNYGCRTDRI